MVYLQQFTRAPRQPKQIFRGEKRKSVISKIIDILDDFRLSKFENEGAIRAGVRSALCLQGNGWQPSDSEAAALLATAFTKMGARRPSWFEGQREFTEATENCIRCGILLDQDTITARDRFCSDMCRETARLYREGLESAINRKIYARSWHVALQRKAPARACSFCSKDYHSSFAEQKYCSYDCSHAAHRDPTRNRECQHCGTGFEQKQLKSRPQRYCSVECRKADWKAEEYSCCICSTSFLAKHKNARFCGVKCRNTFHKRKRLAEAKLTADEIRRQSEAEPSVLVSDASNILRHPALTIEAFDALFKSPRHPTLAETLAASFGGARAFAMEGELVRELRVRFIQEGMSWAAAQAEAERTVQEAIQIAGLERPRSTIGGGYRLSGERKAVR